MAGYDPQKAYKLILDFHGRDGTPDGQHENSQYYKYPKASEYLVAYPLGKKGAEDKNAWQSAPYAALGVNDLQFASDLVDHISNNYCVDTGRIYASGKSNGGGFVDFLACSNVGDRFAAFAMAAPALYSDNAQTACPMKLRKIIHAHGLEDHTIPYNGGPSNDGQLPKIVDWLQWWADRGHCISKQGPVQSNGYKSIVYTSCAGGVTNAIKHYGVDKGGHCWPDDKSDNTDGARSDCKDQSLDFTMMVLDFFNARSL